MEFTLHRCVFEHHDNMNVAFTSRVLGYTIFSYFALKQYLWLIHEVVKTCTQKLCFDQKQEKKRRKNTENCHFNAVKTHYIWHMRVHIFKFRTSYLCHIYSCHLL